MAVSCDYKADYDRLIQRMNDNPNGEFINGYGVLVSEKDDLIRECTLLKPHRVYLMKAIVDLLNELGVTWFLTDGSLLGWNRDKKMTPDDYDIDISIVESDALTVWKNRHKLPSDVVLENVGAADQSGIVWVTDERSIPFDPSTKSAKKLAAYKTTLPPKPTEGPVFFWEAGVDILTYRKEEDGWHNNYNMNGCNLSATAFPNDVIFPLLKTEFEGVEAYVPRDAKRWLEMNYGYLGEDGIWDTELQKYRPPKSST